MRVSITLALENRDHEVVVARNGREGMRKFDRERFDLVITDLIMPEQEGVETIRLLRRQSPDLKIIAISGGGRAANTAILRMVEKLGATAVLAKPFSLEALYAQLDNVLGKGR